MMEQFKRAGLLLLLLLLLLSLAAALDERAESKLKMMQAGGGGESLRSELSAAIVAYGSSGAACIAAIAASRSGAPDVRLLSQTNHIGGMLTGGLQHTDSANDTVVQGITREFFIRTEQQYPGRPTDANYPPGHNPPGWLFEAHVGERVLSAMLAEANVSVVRSVGGVVGVSTSSRRLKGGEAAHQEVSAVTFENGVTYSAAVWIDASYEGGILERVATMTWGREPRSQYGEASAGTQPSVSIASGTVLINPYWNTTANPYDVPSNVIPHVSPAVPATVGNGDLWTEPYDFRLCFTNSPGNKLNFTKPASYNATEWELWRRLYRVQPPKNLAEAGLGCLGPIPNNYSDCGSSACLKCDMLGMNHGTDFTDGSWGYPNGTNEERAVIWRRHVEFTQGLLWFWMSDPAVPVTVREELAQFGHCTDEYDADSDPPHWPHQLYVRQGKRLIGNWVWTEFAPNITLQSRSIGLGSYGFDSHYVSRIIHRTGNASLDAVVREGRVDVSEEQSGGGGSGLGYGCIAINNENEIPVGLNAASQQQQICVAGVDGNYKDDGTCGGECEELSEHQWLAVQRLSRLSNGNRTLTVSLPAGQTSSWFKKSEKLADTLPAPLKMAITDGQVFNLRVPATTHVGSDDTYYFVELPSSKAFSSTRQGLHEKSERCSVCMVAPFVIPYDAMLPRIEEASNILAPVAVSASHVRYNAIRMEPTWMILGHAAGAAAALALQNGSPVQQVDVGSLQKLLLTQHQLLQPDQPLEWALS